MDNFLDLELWLGKVIVLKLKLSIMFTTTFPSIGKRINFYFHEIYKVQRAIFNISRLLYRHGIRQVRSGWADGPAYVTQCPIQTGHKYLYNFTIIGQRGTFWWHAHISWLRSTLYGPIIILPKKNTPYPFAKPYKEVPIIFGN